MEDRETARMRKYGESKTSRIMMATVPHITSGLGLRKFQADGFLLTRVYHEVFAYREHFLCCRNPIHNFYISFTYVWHTPYLQEYRMDRKNTI